MKKENNITTTVNFDIDSIQSKIYLIRDQRVMLDRDLAELYQVETRQLTRQVRRNIERFPTDFMFELSENESNTILMCQNGTSSWGGIRKPPLAFTEQGIAMLSGLLRSPVAIQVNINIMRAFVAMRQALANLVRDDLRFEQLNRKVDNLNHYVDEVLRNQNDLNLLQAQFNDQIGAQLDLINQTLTELQADDCSLMNILL